MSYTKGEWKIVQYKQDKDTGTLTIICGQKNVIAIVPLSPKQANAHLIVAAPSMDILLSLLALGEARFEHSKTTDLVEFCWKGIRYACSDGDWVSLVKTIIK